MTAAAGDRQPRRPGTSPWHWFGRGLVGGLLLLAALNAVSYFFRTPHPGDLVGRTDAVVEALGFPNEVWREGRSYGLAMIDYSAAGWNLLAGGVLGIACGWLGILGRPRLNRWVEEFEAEQAGLVTAKRSGKIQFSVGDLLFLTVVIAALAGLCTQWRGTWQALAAIYFAGPACLIGVAMFPGNLRWQVRAAIVAVLSGIVIATALLSGPELGLPLDHVMLGFFVCWTPQSVFAALLITLGLIVTKSRAAAASAPD